MFRAEESLHTSPLPVFTKVSSLQLFLDNRDDAEYILSKIWTIRKLVMMYTFDDDEDLLDRIMEGDWLENLEELHWGDSLVATFSENVVTINEFYDDGRVSVHHVMLGD
jgi:hypothetical protein